MNRRELLAATSSLAWFDRAAARDEFDAEPTRPPAVATIHWPPLKLLDGSLMASDAWSGTPVIVVFWATWCEFCRRHNAHVTALQRAVAAEPGKPSLRILGVAIDSDEALVRRTAVAHGYGFPIVAGQASLRAQFTPRQVVPMTCLVDAASRVRQCIPGEMSEGDVLGLKTLRWASS